jgi:hypothetical protein
VIAQAERNQQQKLALRTALGQLQQCGVGLSDVLTSDGDDISLEKLNRVMAGKSVELRIRTKAALAACELLRD